MNRVELGAVLAKCREASKVHKNVFANTLGWKASEYLKYERGVSNLKLQGYIDYLNAIGYVISLDGVIIDSALKMSEVISNKIPSSMSRIEFSHQTGLPLSSMDVILNNPEKTSIDTFLNCCKAFGLTIVLHSESEGLSVRFKKTFAVDIKPRFEANRRAFSENLKELRIRNSIPTKNFSFKLGWKDDKYRRYEKGDCNFRLTGCMDYLLVVGGHLVLNGMEFSKAHDVIDFAVSQRSKMTASEMARKMNKTPQFVNAIENKGSDWTIDTLLAYCRVLDIKIELRPKETVTLVGGNGTNINE